MYADGGGKIPLSQLPDDLQKKYGFNAAAAAAAAQASIAQERRDRQALADEEQRHQQQVAANAAAVAAQESAQTTAPPNAVSPATAPASGSQTPAPTNVQPAEAASVKAATNSLTVPDDALSWDQIEQLSTQISDLNIEMAHLRISIGHMSGERLEHRIRGADDTKLEDDSQQMQQLEGKWNSQVSYLIAQRIPGMKLSESEVDAKKSEINDLLEVLGDAHGASTSASHGAADDDKIAKAERLTLLNLEIKYANATLGVVGAGMVVKAMTWDEISAASERIVELEDEMAGSENSMLGHTQQNISDRDEIASLEKKKADFGRQLEARIVPAPKFDDAALAQLKTDIADTSEDKDHLMKDSGNGHAHAHMIAEDVEKLWLLNLKLQYANY